jgi:hypothetical protein
LLSLLIGNYIAALSLSEATGARLFCIKPTGEMRKDIIFVTTYKTDEFDSKIFNGLEFLQLLKQ